MLCKVCAYRQCSDSLQTQNLTWLTTSPKIHYIFELLQRRTLGHSTALNFKRKLRFILVQTVDKWCIYASISGCKGVTWKCCCNCSEAPWNLRNKCVVWTNSSWLGMFGVFYFWKYCIIFNCILKLKLKQAFLKAFFDTPKTVAGPPKVLEDKPGSIPVLQLFAVP